MILSGQSRLMERILLWQIQEAKQRLSELVRRALEDGPQIVTRHGRNAVVVLSFEEYQKLSAGRPDFKQLLRQAPDLERLRLSRDRRPPRRVRL